MIVLKNIKEENKLLKQLKGMSRRFGFEISNNQNTSELENLKIDKDNLTSENKALYEKCESLENEIKDLNGIIELLKEEKEVNDTFDDIDETKIEVPKKEDTKKGNKKKR